MKTIHATYIGALLLVLAGGAQASIDAGQVQFAIGDSRALGAAGTERTLSKGDTVFEGETVITGKNAAVQLRMVDKAIIAVRPNSRLKIDLYRFDGKRDDSERAVLHLIKGAIRSITGLIGHTNKQNYKIKTETANIGIRGTDHEPAYLLPVAAGNGAAGDPGTYDKVNTGGTYIATPWGRVDVSPNQVGFASSEPGSIPVLLDGVPGFLRATPPMAQNADASGADQPERVVGLGSDNPASLEEPWLNSQTLSYLTDPPVVLSQLTPDDLVSESVNFQEAGVYGDVSAGVARNGAFSANVVPAQKFFAGTAVALAASDPVSKFIYNRATVPAVYSGSIDVDGTTVNWGIYGTGAAVNGHTVKDAYTGGAGRKPDYMQVMGALATPDAVVSTLSGQYSMMVTSTPIISYNGTTTALGGQVDSATIELASGGYLKSYTIGVTDAAGGAWSASCSTCGSLVKLADFKTSGIGLQGTDPTGTPNSAAGTANGQVVGLTGQGIISSFALQGSAKAITGSFAVKQ